MSNWAGTGMPISAQVTYAPLSDLKAYLGITANDHDDLLYSCLVAATAAIKQYTGRVFSVTMAETQYYDAVADTDDDILYIDECCGIENVVNGDGMTLPANAYVTVPSRATPFYGIRLRVGSGLHWTYDNDPTNAIAVTGYWGYSQTPPADVRQACIRWAGYIYRQRESTVYDVTTYPETGIIVTPQGIPKDVALLLKPYQRLS